MSYKSTTSYKVALNTLLIGMMVVLTFSTALANIGPGSLSAPLTPHNRTHYKLQVGTCVTAQIIGATDLPVGTTSVDVYIKSSTLGNTTVVGSVSGTTITFNYCAPVSGCLTTNVAYGDLGNTANNDIIADGVKDGKAGRSSQLATAGFAFTDAAGNVVQNCSGGSCNLSEIGRAHI